MKKKYLTLSLILPCYLLGDVHLGEISVVENKQSKTNSIEVDLVESDQHQANSVFDLFKNQSSVEVAGGGSSNAKRIYLRGSESSTLNITLDGATQGTNIFQHRGNEIGINPDILKVVNVRTAPDASKGGALGGAVEMSTKDAQDFVKNGKNQGAIFKVGYNTNTSSQIGSLTAYSVFDKNYGVVASVSGINAQNYKDGHNDEMYATAYQDRNYFLKFTAENLNNNDLKISFNKNSNGGDMQWGKNGSDKGPTPEDAALEKIVATTTSYTLEHKYNGSKLLNLDTNINYTNILVDRRDANSQYDNNKIGVKIQNHFYIDSANTKNKFSVGFDIKDEESTSNQAVTRIHVDNDPSHYAPTSSLNQALFIQSKTTINNFAIRYGLRVDDYKFETGLGKANDTTYSPNIGIEYKINDNSNVYANYGQSSRMSGTIPFTWMMNVVDNKNYSKDLKAENSIRYEVGYNYKKEALFTNSDAFKFDANVFKTDIENLILAYSGQKKGNGGISGAGEGGAPLTDIRNSDYDYYLKGFEIKGSYYIDDYFASLSYTQIDTNVYDEKAAGEAGEPLAIRRVGTWDNKKLVFNTGVELSNGLVLDYTLTAVADIDNPDQVTRDGYATHDVSAKYQASKKSPWTFYVAVNNLTNEYYAPHTTLEDTTGDYRRDMGRDFRFSIKYEL